jgi:uncharacterized protein (DUF779 family)
LLNYVACIKQLASERSLLDRTNILNQIEYTMNSTMVDHVIATDSALALLASLREKYGPLMFFQSGGCCDECSTSCYVLGDICVGTADVYLGNIDGTPFYMGYDQFEYWQNTQLVIDAVDGVGGPGSLDNGTGKCFLTRSRRFSYDENKLLEGAGSRRY